MNGTAHLLRVLANAIAADDADIDAGLLLRAADELDDAEQQLRRNGNGHRPTIRIQEAP